MSDIAKIGILLGIFLVYLLFGTIASAALDDDISIVLVMFWPLMLIGLIIVGLFTCAANIGKWIGGKK